VAERRPSLNDPETTFALASIDQRHCVLKQTVAENEVTDCPSAVAAL
jgi:hypothetical protein